MAILSPRRKSNKATFDIVANSEFILGRQARPGPEANLVEQFLLDLPFDTQRNCRVTVFREPRLQSGFPDLVAVLWHEPTTRLWDEARAGISADDVRLVHFLASHGPRDEEGLAHMFQRRVKTILTRLAALHLVYECGGFWRASALSRCFAVRQIIAFEAKVSDWRAGLRQASLNRWFASESYVLLPGVRNQKDLLDEAKALGVGVWIAGDLQPILRSSSSCARQPVSYASWLFNEWSWRCAVANGHREQ
jgi:hypothetical protein